MSDCIYRTIEYVELHQGEVLGLRNSVISLAAKENSKNLPTIPLQQTPTSATILQNFSENTNQQKKSDSSSEHVSVEEHKIEEPKTEESKTEEPKTEEPKLVESSESNEKTEPITSSTTTSPPLVQEKQDGSDNLERHAFAITPHDMCILYKSKSITVPQNDSEMESYFHYCIGLDASSPMSISTYILKLLENQQPPGWLEYYKYKVFKACFCIYNFFSNIDVRIEFHFPGNTKSYTIDQDGKRVDEISEQIWKETAVCSYLRSLEFLSIHHSSLSINHISRCVKVLPFQDHLSLENEETYLHFAMNFIAKNSQLVFSFQLANHIFNYLKSFGRFHLAYKLFNPLSQTDPSYLPFMAQIYTAQKDIKECTGIWTKTSAIYSENYIMIAEYLKFSAEEFYKLRRATSATSPTDQTALLDTLRWCMDRISKFEPKTIHALLCEAKCQVMLGNYESAFQCMQKVPKKTIELLVLKPYNFPKKIALETIPLLAEFSHPKWMDMELAEKGFFFGNEQSGMDETVATKDLEPLIVSVGTHSIFNDPIKNEMYSIIVQMYNLMGWDQFRKHWEQFKTKANPVSETLQLLMEALPLDLKLLGRWTLEEDNSIEQSQLQHQQYTAMDWFLRAELAQRLQLSNFALLAFRKSVARADNTRSLVALLDLYTQKLVQNMSNFEKLDKSSTTFNKQSQEFHSMQDKLLVDVLGFVEKLFGFCLSDKCCPPEDKEREAHRYLHVHPKCMQALFKCVGVFGLQHVLKKVKQLPHNYREHFYNYLFLAVGWNVLGFEK